MRGEGIVCALLASGCDVVWRLDDVRPASEPDAPDAPTVTGCEGDTHDEDGDLHADSCDRCPGIADDQADADGDDVGDACDPSPIETNSLALFVSFAEKLDRWRAIDGAWSNDGDSLVYESVALGVHGISLYSGALPDPPFVLEYRFVVDSIDAQGSGVAIVVDADTTGRGVTCGIQRHEQPIIDVVRNTYAQAVLSSETEIMSIVPGGYRVVAAYDRDDGMRCALSSDSGLTGGATTMNIPSSARPAPGTLGVRSLRVATRVQYIAIYK